jgi:hypothetical protein
MEQMQGYAECDPKPNSAPGSTEIATPHLHIHISSSMRTAPDLMPPIVDTKATTRVSPCNGKRYGNDVSATPSGKTARTDSSSSETRDQYLSDLLKTMQQVLLNQRQLQEDYARIKAEMLKTSLYVSKLEVHHQLHSDSLKSINMSLSRTEKDCSRIMTKQKDMRDSLEDKVLNLEKIIEAQSDQIHKMEERITMRLRVLSRVLYAIAITKQR